jgi:paraquat-inducible protein B
MTDRTQQPDDIPAVKTIPEGKRSLSLVWIIPIVAALIGGWLVVKTILEQGPTITIQFKDAFGLEAGKTAIKYKDFDIGLVKDLKLSEDRSHFIVTAQLVKEAKAFLVEDTDFWVVRPRIAGGQISGLGTLLSGSYIGMDPGSSTNSHTKLNFVGLENPPDIVGDRKGKEFVLHSDTLGSLEVGSPINYRGFKVGDVVNYQLGQDGKGVVIRVFVDTPYDKLVTEDTRFWNASGIDVKLDANGVQVNTQSLVSMLIGGLSFETPENSTSTSPASEKSAFTLYHSRELAMTRHDAILREMVLYFQDSLRGLSVGAPVDFNGILVGKVSAINVDFDQKDKSFRFPVTVSIDASGLRGRQVKGKPLPPLTDETYRTTIEKLANKGLRAQLKSGNLLTGQLYVALDFFPQAPPAKLVWNEDGTLELPTIQGQLSLIGERVDAVLTKIERMPINEVIEDARKTLATLNDTLEKFGKLSQRLESEVTPEAVSTLVSAKHAADNMEKMLAADAPLQEDMRAALQELTRAAESMRVLTDYLETHPEALIRGKKKEE